MKKIKENQIFIIIILLIILIIGFFYTNYKKEIPVVPIIQNHYQDNTRNINEKSQIEIKPLSVKNIDKDSFNHKTIKISLIVSDKKYEAEIKKDSSVFDAMKSIEENNTKDNLFSFKYKDYSSLGSFITEINGVKGEPGKYWIYYVNNEKASVGVSKFILKERDIIRWEQEGI